MVSPQCCQSFVHIQSRTSSVCLTASSAERALTPRVHQRPQTYSQMSTMCWDSCHVLQRNLYTQKSDKENTSLFLLYHDQLKDAHANVTLNQSPTEQSNDIFKCFKDFKPMTTVLITLLMDFLAKISFKPTVSTYTSK